MSQWISVKTQLPEKDPWKVYAVLVNENNLHKHQIAWFQYSDKSWRLERKNTTLNVTHWFPLPDYFIVYGRDRKDSEK